MPTSASIFFFSFFPFFLSCLSYLSFSVASLCFPPCRLFIFLPFYMSPVSSSHPSYISYCTDCSLHLGHVAVPVYRIFQQRFRSSYTSPSTQSVIAYWFLNLPYGMCVIQSVLSICDYTIIRTHQVDLVPNVSIISFSIFNTCRILWKVSIHPLSLFVLLLQGSRKSIINMLINSTSS
jgi:hypothetical protein